jgi:hypothetical protein
VAVHLLIMFILVYCWSRAMLIVCSPSQRGHGTTVAAIVAAASSVVAVCWSFFSRKSGIVALRFPENENMIMQIAILAEITHSCIDGFG